MVKGANIIFLRYSSYIVCVCIFKPQDRISGVTFNVFASSVVDTVFEPWSGQN